jgi:hypothetical protein
VRQSMAKGATAIIVVETGRARAESVSVEITCPDADCPPAPPDSGGATPGDHGTGACLAASAARGEARCSAIDCACSHCPQDYDDCATVPGCREILRCMTAQRCVANECLDEVGCRDVIQTYGGASGPPFQTSSRLQSCGLTFACALPCDAVNEPKDAAAPRPDAEAGVPGRDTPIRPGNCDCNVGRAATPFDPGDVILAIAFGACVRARRSRARHRTAARRP